MAKRGLARAVALRPEFADAMANLGLAETLANQDLEEALARSVNGTP